MLGRLGLSVPMAWVSRHKTLLRRRRINVKKRTASKKKLASERQHFNYAHEYKSLQIQKELDRRVHPSQHLNELMDEIFYPDITKKDEVAALGLSGSKDFSFGEYGDELEEMIEEQVLPADLLEGIYLENMDEFEPVHY